MLLSFEQHPIEFLQSALRVPVVIYSGLTPTEEARLFIDINTKQRQVPNELLLDIKQLAEREDDRDALLREIFDIFSDDPSSSLMGLMSSSSRQKSEYLDAFNLALLNFLFNCTTSSQSLTLFAAFVDALAKLGLEDRITSPTIFRAIMDTFPEVARISAAQHGKSFTKSKFSAVISPIAQALTVGNSKER